MPSVPQGGPPIPRCSLTLTKRKKIAPPSLYASLLAGTTGGELSKFFSSVKQLLISRGEKLTFFVGSETRDTGKRASPSRREEEGGGTDEILLQLNGFLPSRQGGGGGGWRRNTKLKRKAEQCREQMNQG